MVRFRGDRSAARVALPETERPSDASPASDPRFAILIPAYNHGRTLGEIVSGALRHSRFVLVVDDGSTDDSARILERLGDRVTWIRFRRNRGKGVALRKGFAFLRNRGFSHAVTLDADGQHFPEDIPAMIAASKRRPEAIVVGQRDMRLAGAPWRSRIGLWLSNSLARQLAGLSLSDTQAGFRVYPLAALDSLPLMGTGFDLELEVLVRAVGQGVPVVPFDIRCTYRPRGGRISHFRPLRDPLRIGLRLLTVLLLLGARSGSGQRLTGRSARALTK